MQQPSNLESSKSDNPLDIRQTFINLSSIKDQTKILEYHKVLVLIHKVMEQYSQYSLDILKLSFEYDFCRIICNMIEASYNQLDTYMRNLTEIKSSNEDKQLEKYLEVSLIIIEIVQNFSNDSIKFVREAHENQVVAFLFGFLKNKKLIDCYAIDSDKKAGGLVRSVIVCMVNFSRMSSSYSEKWKAENALGTLIDVSEKLKDKDDCQLTTYIVIANIADDNEINNMKGK